jgi:hypothetical protein
MIVSHAHRFIFFHNPKCAGTSFRDTIKPYHDDEFIFWGAHRSSYFKNEIDHTHLRLWELHAQFPHLFSCAETYNSVVFVRNPFDRFLSAVNEHMKKFQQHVAFASMSSQERLVVIEDFVQNVLNIPRITTDARFVHFSPQIWYLNLAGRTIPRHIIPITKDGSFGRVALAVLGLPYLKLPWHNPSSVDLTSLRRSRVVMKFIEEFYADDIAFFLADETLAELANLDAA